jgi:hypothetical protein
MRYLNIDINKLSSACYITGQTYETRKFFLNNDQLVNKIII